MKLLAKKSCIGHLSNDEICSLKFLYYKKYPEISSLLTNGALEVPFCFNKFLHAFIKKKKVSSRSENSKKPHVAAIPTVPFLNDEHVVFHQHLQEQQESFSLADNVSLILKLDHGLPAASFPLDGQNHAVHQYSETFRSLELRQI